MNKPSPATPRPVIDDGPATRSAAADGRYGIGAALLDGREREAVDAALTRAEWTSSGEPVDEFEEAFEPRYGAATAVASGSVASHLAYHVLGARPGRRVLMPMLGPPAAACAAAAAGFLIDWVPVDESLCMDVERAWLAAGPDTAVVAAHHVWGSACDLGQLDLIADRHDAVLIEDATTAHGAAFEGTRVGSTGRLAVFDFGPHAIVTTGSGGVLAGNARLIHHARALAGTGEDTFEGRRLAHPPAQVSMHRLAAVIGLVQLTRLHETIGRLRAARAVLETAVSGLPGVTPRRHADMSGDTGTHLAFTVASPAEAAWTIKALTSEGVYAIPICDPTDPASMFVGDQVDLLRAAGIRPPDPDLLAEQHALLSRFVVVPVDITWTDGDLAEAATALREVLGR